ncbi:hypothetical protein AB0L70_35680, partial [Kribbella sp. NPDC051952]
LNDVGFTIPAAGATYWVGEAMGSVDYNDAGPKPDTTGLTTKTEVARVHGPSARDRFKFTEAALDPARTISSAKPDGERPEPVLG